MVTDSGGAQTLANAVALYPTLLQSIKSVTYIDPITATYPQMFPNTRAVLGTGGTNLAFVTAPYGVPVIYDTCDHGDISCHIRKNSEYFTSIAGPPCSDRPTITAYLPSVQMVTYPGLYGTTSGFRVLDAAAVEGIAQGNAGKITSVSSTINYGPIQ